MTEIRHPHSDLIDALGAKVLREQFSLTHQRLHAWRKRGIPHTHRAAIANLMMLAGKNVPEGFLSPPELERAA